MNPRVLKLRPFALWGALLLAPLGAHAEEARPTPALPTNEEVQQRQVLEAIAARTGQRRSGGIQLTGFALGETQTCAQVQAALNAERNYNTIGNSTPESRLERARVLKSCLELQKRVILEEAGALRDVRTYPVAKAFIDTQLADDEALLLKATADETSKTEFRGMSFGMGAGFSRSKTIVSAGLAANGTIRITEARKDEPRIILEAHYYGLCQLKKCREGTLGVGPFFGIAPEADTINAFALGVMLGFKDKQPQPQSFSIGLGAVLDRNHQTLAPGFAEGQALPAGESAPVLVKKSKWSPLLFVTRTF